MLVVEAIKPERIVKKTEVLNFLDKIFQNESGKIFSDAMELIRENNAIDENSNIALQENSNIAQLAFNNILETRISLELNQNSSKSFEIKFIETSNIFKVYCNVKNFFLIPHLELLKKVSHEDILGPLFEFYLPDLFEWLTAIKKIHDNIVKEGNSVIMTNEFRNCIEDLYYKLEDEGMFQRVEMLRLETFKNNNTKKYKTDKNQKKNDFYEDTATDDKELSQANKRNPGI
ncbi:7369_t:CDS:2 [Racocetra persica]|uniref:7369_t:CDS:1 n=1 Tax=Racocetra persica TaxID=160502 RepID=A0ACA9KHP1_9GLOM|nr:7369_t:CDS:2 [Racocetra persica]